MELSFELLREAGLRMPGPIGNTIGIVGGLIIGQAAVSANIVSPVVVVVVALTALGSFSIPNEELFREFPVDQIWNDRPLCLLRHFGPDVWMGTGSCASGRTKKLWHPLFDAIRRKRYQSRGESKDSLIRFP